MHRRATSTNMDPPMTATLHRALDEPTPRDLEALLELCRHLAAGDSLEEILDVVSRDFRSLLPFERIEYARIDGDKVLVDWVRAFDAPEAIPEGSVCPTGPRAAVDSRHPYLIYDLVEYTDGLPDDHAVRTLVDAGYRASIACPLEGLDAIVFFNTVRPNEWNRRHLTLVEMIAGHLSVAAQRAELTARLRHTNDQLMAAQTERAAFVAAVSHEIRTPLTAIVGLTGTLRDDLDRLSPEEIAEFVHTLDQQAREVQALVEDLLVAARADAAELQVRLVSVDVAQVVTDTVRGLSPGKKPVVEPGDSVLALADPLRLRQILRNLLSNADRHGGDDVRIAHHREGDRVVIEVSDDGAGLPPEIEGATSEPFVLSASSHPESVGLGLPVSRALATAMGGKLVYERRDDRTVMRVDLPIA